MTTTDYEKLRARIEDQYHQDLAALERVRRLLREDQASPAAAEDTKPKPAKPRGRRARKDLSADEKKERKRAYMKAYHERHKVGKANGNEKGLTQKAFSKFLVKGPIAAGGIGEA